MTDDLARLSVRDLPGVFAARWLGRELAAGLGLDHQDQVRVALDELRRNNEDLIAALEDATRQKEQLQLLNAELQETNRGVVALYAELDEKSDQLRAASESKNRFWANISHELRTPLHSITGLTRLLAEPEAGLGTGQLYQAGLIRNSTGTLLTLVNDLLDVAKAESGQMVLNPAEVSLPGLPTTLRELTRPMAGGKPVEVAVSADEAPATILTDEAALTAILRNLLSNAIKYTEDGEVRLTVRTAPGQLEIQVADTGTGIPGGQLERVFEEFYQVPGAKRGGTGLGLPYARRLARLLDGELTLTSAAGRGTTAVAGGRVDLVLTGLGRPGVDGHALLERLPGTLPAIIITGRDVAAPRRAAALLRKDQLTRERLAFAIRHVSPGPR